MEPTPPRPHRLFVAISPPDPVRRRLAALVADLKRSAGRAGGDVRWIPPENVHLTLQFLGAVPDERVEDVKAAVSAAAATAAGALSLEVRGAGGF
ncbi:MAG TPA: 2'-5' RNA ligase family protein, partial [Anaeromyxobacteraceae bacterium]|nr:2'-5' RNA ligase family protein [Anaeromyxobacteraceae bacterium]